MNRLKYRKFEAALAFALIVSFVYGSRSHAQTANAPNSDAMEIAPDRGAAGMYRWLGALQTRASLLMFTAHPDDEDGGMLAYESRGQGARVALLTLNRGEGGQNVMSPDLYDALGLVRTEELLQADRYMGVEQYFSRVIDYGFSKTREEALEKWDHDRVLSDAVRVIRMVRPLVVTSVFVGAATDGHGNHQVAGQMAQEAWVAAGDPAKFPEQVREGLRPWSPLKVYARVPQFEITERGMYDYAIDKYVPVRFFDYVNQKWSDTKPSTTLEVPEGLPAPAVGLTFLQIAREGLGLQKTQNGGGVTPPPAPQNTAYHRYGSRVPSADREKSFFDGTDITLRGISSLASGDTLFLKTGLDRIANLAAEALKDYSADRPNAIAPVLADGLRATRELIEQVRTSPLPEPGKSDVIFELRVKERQFEKALSSALDIHLQTLVAAERPPETARVPAGNGRERQGNSPEPPGRGGPGRAGAPQGPSFAIAIPEQSFHAEARIYNQTADPLRVAALELVPSDGKTWSISADGTTPKQVPAGKEEVWRFAVKVPADAALTRPYFSRPDEEQPWYELTDPRYRNLPQAPYPLTVHARFTYKDVSFDVDQVLQSNERINGIGNVSNPLLVGPAISVTVSPSAGAIPIGSKSFAFAATIHSNVKGPAKGTVRLRLPQGWRSEPAEAPFSMARDGENHTIAFSVSPDQVKSAEYSITVLAEYNGHNYEEGYRLAGYPGVRPYPFYRPATYKAVGVEVKTPQGLSVGFLPGTGDDVPKGIENLGQNVRVLSETDISQGELRGYDAIILGVRAYAVRPDLKAANGRLLDYVRNGGVLIVQYNLQGFDGNYGPYPFSLGANPQKVVDENSPVAILDPNDAAFTWPNRITEADFKGWVEERGHGFMATWDTQYKPLIETHDPDQDPQKGGLLIARYGKGFYVYDALALYRQLPAGVPGAYRLLANLVSLRKNPAYN
jgi:LmbE family N-acetylglucosaminyl deacetylase